jgi:RNA-binding protein
MALTSKQRQHLKGLAHGLNPAVWIGQSGLTDAVIEKINAELEAHELIKVKFADGPQNREEHAAVAERVRAEVVQVIGRITAMYRRRASDPGIVLPKG